MDVRQGKPVGLTLTIEGGKVLATGKLTYDPGAQALSSGSDRARSSRGKDDCFEGTLDQTGKYLVLDHAALGGKGREVGRCIAVVDVAQCQLHPLHDGP